jgi:MFS family permease
MRDQKTLAYEIRVVLLLGLAYGFAFYDRQTMSFLSPFVAKDFGLNNTQIGALGSGLSLTWALGACLIGYWSDRMGLRKPFLLAFMLIFSACSVLSGLSTGFWTLLASRVVMGLVEGPFLPICLAFIAAASPDQRRGLNSGIVQNVFGSVLGNALAPILVVWIAVNWGWRESFYVAGLPGLILFFLVWKFVSEPPRFAAAPAIDPVHEAPSEAEAGLGAKLAGGLVDILSMLKERNIALCALMSPLLIGMLVLTAIFFPLYLTQVRGYSNETMSYIMSVTGLCPAIGAVIITGISDRVGRKWPMFVGATLTALSPFAAVWFQGSVTMLTVLMFIGTLGVGMMPLYMGVVPAETLKSRNIAAAMGVVVMIGELTGGVIAPVVAGWLADRTTLETPLLIAGAMSVLAGIICLFIRETNPAVLARRAGAAVTG